VQTGEQLLTHAAQMTERADNLLAAAAVLERGVAIVEPLEGVVQRLGRIADRLPGERRKGQALKPDESQS
jgi:hypothetical protein